jgi:hypothetical protein
MTGLAVSPNTSESVLDLARRLAEVIEQAAQDSTDGGLPESSRERAADLVEALRRHVARKWERDPRSLFDIDQRMVDLMDRVEEAAEAGEIP